MNVVRVLTLPNGSQRPNEAHCFALPCPAHMKHRQSTGNVNCTSVRLLAKEATLLMKALFSTKVSSRSDEMSIAIILLLYLFLSVPPIAENY